MIRKVYAVALSAMLFSFVACEKAEIVDRYYLNYEQLRASAEPGNWVPTFIPHSAVEIRARYKIDTGAELVTFYVAKPDDLSVTSHCKNSTKSSTDLPPKGFLNVTWWPEPLFQNQDRNESVARYEFYTCEGQAFLALEREGGGTRAFYWSISVAQ